MSIDQIASILRRRLLTFVFFFGAAVAAVVAVTLTLPKTYETTATLYTRIEPSGDAYADATRAEQLTRMYSALVGNLNVADEVVENLPMEMSRSELLGRMSFAPVERTQLIQITAEGSSPREAQLLANTYAETFVDRIDTLVREEKAPTELSISEPAALPQSASKPNPPLYIGFGTLLSLFLALGVVLLRDRLDTRVYVEPEEDTVLGQPIMARIPRIATRDGRVGREIADAFGVLKTNLDFFDEKPARVVLVTSPGTSEGKSTVASQLALAAVEDGERVVVVEADLRRPGLDGPLSSHEAGRAPVGLSNYLAGAASEHEILVPHPKHRDLTVIWSGLIPPNPTALLSSHRLDTLIDSLRLDYDRVVIDTCPISVGADASVIASRVDGTLYIIDERKTKRTEAQAGLNQLRNVQARLLGVVLNRTTSASTESYYYGERAPEEPELTASQSE
jgi:succinoglycan biosynthesis transport protein ExoP